jgi:sirohydrochlorin cobaltochelatase
MRWRDRPRSHTAVAAAPGERGGRALLLVGHGSALGPDAGAPIRAHGARIRDRQLFDEVHVAFVKEEPLLPGAVARCASAEVFVVPMFLAEGYYTRQVVPRALGLTGRTTRLGDQEVHYCPAVGTHPGMRHLVLQRARRVLDLAGVRAADSALVIIGHGTERDPASGETAYRLTERLAMGYGFSEVVCGFLDQEPGIRGVVDRLASRLAVLVPFFIAAGMHTRETIPQLLALSGPRTDRAGKVLWYTPPVGTLPAIARVAVDLARRAPGVDAGRA